MKSTILFLKQTTHCTEVKSEGSVLLLKKSIFYKEIMLKSTKKVYFYFFTYLNDISNKLVFNYFHLLKRYIKYIILNISNISKTTLSKIDEVIYYEL